MLFNSIQFLIFFPLVTGLYFLLPFRWRWGLLLSASCIFYMYFIPVYILILLFTILVDYVAGILIEGAEGNRRKRLLALSIVANVGVLAVFKYFNFANTNLAALAHFIGWNYPIQDLKLILPIGLSFHTFQAMSYTIEVYRGNQKAERHPGIYALYVMFYPQLVAGPIERPQNLLHQFHEPHSFDYGQATTGLKLMLYGLFMKTVVADRLAIAVNSVYGNPLAYSGPVFVLATIMFAFQIFCDFAGYSNIAIGAARVMGFTLMRNFDRPYHARSISEFWRRWHISLSTWFKDYLYIPLGGSRVSVPRWYLNLMIVFLISGLWHGAKWTFLIWGGLHGLYLIAGIVTHASRQHLLHAWGIERAPRLHRMLQTGTVFTLVCFGWIFFRADSVSDAWFIVSHLGTGWGEFFKRPSMILLNQGLSRNQFLLGLLGVIVIESVHAIQSRTAIAPLLASRSMWLRWSFYMALALVVINLSMVSETPFIYFQF